MTKCIVGIFFIALILIISTVMVFNEEDNLIVRLCGFILCVSSAFILGCVLHPEKEIICKGIVVDEFYFYCPKCNKYNSSKHEYCSKCGEKFNLFEEAE